MSPGERKETTGGKTIDPVKQVPDAIADKWSNGFLTNQRLTFRLAPRQKRDGPIVLCWVSPGGMLISSLPFPS